MGFFLLAISTALWQIDPIGIDKLCGLIGDAVVVLLAWPLRNEFLRPLRQNKIIVAYPDLRLVLLVLNPSMAIGDCHGGFPHKNNLCKAMALTIVTALCLLMQGWRPRI